jgi:hypothetical protein
MRHRPGADGRRFRTSAGRGKATRWRRAWPRTFPYQCRERYADPVASGARSAYRPRAWSHTPPVDATRTRPGTQGPRGAPQGRDGAGQD